MKTFFLTLLLALLIHRAFAAPDWNDAVLISNGNATGAAVEWPGGVGIFAVTGNFGGATVTLQFLGPDGVTYIVAGAATTLTAAGAGIFDLPRCKIQAVVSGGTPSALYAAASRLTGITPGTS